jgi:hypothetical protein
MFDYALRRLERRQKGFRPEPEECLQNSEDEGTEKCREKDDSHPSNKTATSKKHPTARKSTGGIPKTTASKSTGGIPKATARKSTGGVCKATAFETPNATSTPIGIPKPIIKPRSASRGRRDHSTDFPETMEELWLPHKGVAPPKPGKNTALHSVKLIPWGGEVSYGGKRYSIGNTCNVDNQLQILYTMYKLHNTVHQYLNTSSQSALGTTAGILRGIFYSIEEEDWTLAREQTLFNLMNLTPAYVQTGDLFESEQRFLDAVAGLVPLKQHIICSNPKCVIAGTSDVTPLNGFVARSPELFELFLNTTNNKPQCESCYKQGSSTTSFSWGRYGAPPIFGYPLAQHNYDVLTTEAMIPDHQVILGERYEVVAYTVLQRAHFLTVFLYNGKRYIYDGLSAESIKPWRPFPGDHRVSTIWLKLT